MWTHNLNSVTKCGDVSINDDQISSSCVRYSTSNNDNASFDHSQKTHASAKRSPVCWSVRFRVDFNLILIVLNDILFNPGTIPTVEVVVNGKKWSCAGVLKKSSQISVYVLIVSGCLKLKLRMLLLWG